MVNMVDSQQTSNQQLVKNSSSTNNQLLRNKNNLSADLPCRTDDCPSPKSFQSLFPPSQPFLRQHHLSILDQRSPQFIGQAANSMNPRPTIKALTPGTVTNNRFLLIVQEPVPYPFNMTTSSVILHPEIDQSRSALVKTESLESVSTCFGSEMVGNQSGRESNLIAGVFTRNQSQELVQTLSYDSFQSSLKPKTENIHFSHSSPHVHCQCFPSLR
ncbi:hypothetical protein PPACK8108_LOCUS25225 [Phakopsora pachyrhizi]|uniref:Uncharacterized protein n=1 Tax=Phakopsora pachyrhizi TaxID=170000 RepID=A0AAV0BT89_PHAPC|nr:hypothetical protein PPACK8108_LOCUS25225 [Phakopsora pachyrhizi]